MSFQENWSSTAKEIDAHLKSILSEMGGGDHPAILRLREAMQYSVIEAGKRFRPVLCLWTADAVGGFRKDVLPFAAAVEMVHGYSLIHDDLPCMDDDDLRRNKPTNHKVFGEAMALLAGNALLTETFAYLAGAYRERPELAIQLIELLSRASGVAGLLGGQAIDISKAECPTELGELDYLHSKKTGALIRAAVAGALAICGIECEDADQVIRYAEELGIAFQIADDLLDHAPDRMEPASCPGVLGVPESRRVLAELTERAVSRVSSLGPAGNGLKELATFNCTRNH